VPGTARQRFYDRREFGLPPKDMYFGPSLPCPPTFPQALISPPTPESSA